MNRGLFVTGTDTGVGKSLVSATLLHVLRGDGRPAVGMKPVASGCERGPDGLRNADALQLQAASEPRPPYEWVNPVALADPTAPQIAAARAGLPVSLAPILAAHRQLQALAGRVVVEGLGGWLSGLGGGLEQADLVRALDLPVLLVVGLRLGCLNHARLTARAVAADGCHLLGWVGSRVEPPGEDAEAYLGLLSDTLCVPCLGVLPHAPDAHPAELARFLTVA
ncbi:MAG TPA: dethiobiotin synthase [Arenimonas sp.]|nr:dethiobiotin synthase [Arenimonas sp.]